GGVKYVSSGTKYVRLTGTHSGGSKASLLKSLEVSSGTSPDIDFSYTGICLSTPTTFTSINTSGDITTYSWDFDGDGIEDSTDPNPAYQFSSAGEYEVTLTVQNDGGCSNTSRQTIGIYDISEPDFSITYNGGLCSNNTLSLKDLTPNLPPDSLVTWTWDFNGEATILGKDTTYAFATAGEKIITLTVGIPGCEASVSKTINLLEGPTVGFTVGSNCISPTTQFNNTTTGDGITGYTWDFGNGYTSSVENPETFFETIGDYQVSLTVNNDLGCETTFTEKVAISAIPVPDFKHDLACSGAAVQFTDQSTAENANITEWSWDFAGLGTSNERNPIFEFPTAGKYTVTLSVSSNYGCSKILTREIDVLPSPTVAFLVNTGCEGQATTFVDQSTSDAENPIVDRLWSINNQFYSSATVNEVFKNPGSYDVTLQITTKNLCTISLTKTVQVNELPSIDFGFTSACVNELTEFNDLSTSPDDPIISRKWDFAGQASANGPKAYYQFKQAGNYNVSLFLKTEKGCEISISKNVTINNSPVAAFSHSLSVGQLPVTVNFTNESNGATAYSWFVGDGVASVSNEQDISRVFDKEGDYLVSLVAFNEFGCSDTTTSVVTVALPKIDLQLRSVNYTDTEGKLRFILNIANRGSIAQTNFPIEIVVDDRVTISEKYNGTVAPGKSVSHSLQFELVIANSPVEKVCIKLVPILKDGEFEFSPQDNSNCLSFTEGFLVNNPYPNPVDDRLTFELILPEAGDAEVTVLSMTGQPMFSEKYYALKAGLTSLSLQMAHFNKGIYLLRVQSKGNEAVRRIVKR
ncbi:MAG: PKD domain-containing protein, partial [Imperialibacter sp.]|uniref:T9SS type A sorting domain-containing protein n=1 Tax=Imperialibacter sp. TaxID=2038411 RepID=UPI0032EE7B00